MKRTVSPGVTRAGRLFVTIDTESHEDKLRLSITGVEGPLANGDARGSCGQCVGALDRIEALSTGWTAEMAAHLKDVWDRWHLNDMRAGCEHQRQIDTSRKVEVVTYGITHEAQRLRDKTRKAAAGAMLKGAAFSPSPTERALAELEDWYADRFQPPDSDSPLSGCFEVRKRERKAIGWVTREEHPEGMLSTPCAVCGYKYGSAWLYEPVPDDVLVFLGSLPESDIQLPARWR